jgi:hypothetical protein
MHAAATCRTGIRAGIQGVGGWMVALVAIRSGRALARKTVSTNGRERTAATTSAATEAALLISYGSGCWSSKKGHGSMVTSHRPGGVTPSDETTKREEAGKVGKPREGRQARKSQADLRAGKTLKSRFWFVRKPGLKLKRGDLQEGPGTEREAPEEVKKPEGSGSRSGLTAGSRAQGRTRGTKS